MGAWDEFAPTGQSAGLFNEFTRAETPEERIADQDRRKRELDREIVAGMSWPERQVTAFGENARHAIRQGSNLLTGDPTNEQLLEESRALDALREGAPVASVLGGGSISIPPMVVLGAAVPAGASLGTTLGVGGALGAGQGAVFSDPGQRLRNAGVGFMLGAGLPAVASGVSRVAGAAPELVPGFLKRGAEAAAVRSTNADRTAFKKAFGRPYSPEKVEASGRFLLDEGIPLRSPSAIKEGLEDVLKQEGPQVGNLVKKATGQGAEVDLWEATQNALQDPRLVRLAQNTEQGSMYSRASEFLRDQLERNGAKITPEKAHEIRRTLDELATWDQATPKALTKAWRAVRGSIDDQLEKSMKAAGLGDEWAATNARFAAASKAKGLADIGAERRAGNQLGSLTEKMAVVPAAVGAMASGNPAVMLALPAYALANRFGNPVLARTLDALSRRAGTPATAGPRGASSVLEQARRFLAEQARLSSVRAEDDKAGQDTGSP